MAKIFLISKDTDFLINPKKYLMNITRRPEFGAAVGLVIIYTFFSIAANDNGFNSIIVFRSILDMSVSIGIIGMFATLLLISGEFDLSVGSMVAATSMLIGLCIVEWNMPVWLALVITFIFALIFGALQGFIVVKAKMPSLIVTLGGLFFLRGITYGVSRSIVGRSIIGGINEGLQETFLYKIFAGKIFWNISASVIWWILVAITSYLILKRTKFGNWIFSTGGSEKEARALGVPTDKVRIILFMATAGAAALFSTCQVLSFGSADSMRGTLKEMEVIITVVVGGTLITGGYGSPIGTFLGCLTLGVLRQGIYMIGIAPEWYQAVLGLVLIVAVFINRNIQKIEDFEK